MTVLRFAIYHLRCRHVIGLEATRPRAEAMVSLFAAAGQHQWRIRADATDKDATAVLAGTRCVVCSHDREVVVG